MIVPGGQRPAVTAKTPIPAWLQGYLISCLENAGKTDMQLNAQVENQDRPNCGKNEAGGMKSSCRRRRKQVGNGAADDRPDDAKHDCPKERHVHVHHRFRDDPRDQSNNNVPD
jgi:hypothetical protein